MNLVVNNSELFDSAIEALLATDISYGPGFANHGPMVVEALEHRNRSLDIEPFLASYVPRLKAKQRTAEPMTNWVDFVAHHVERLAPEAAAAAGHGLLRLAHAVRAVERSNTPVRRADLAEAVDYWASSKGIAGLTPMGQRSLAEALPSLPRLRPPDTAGMLTRTLQMAASNDEVQAVLASLAPPVDHGRFLDALALAAVDRYLANGDTNSFVFIHGVTVSTMASVLLPYLDEDGRKALAGAVAGFVLYAVAGFDRVPEMQGTTVAGSLPSADISDDELAALAVATLDDHTIKFTDACLTLAARTGGEDPRAAALARILATSHVAPEFQFRQTSA